MNYLQLMHSMLNQVYMPINGKAKCNFIDCVHGMGLAGSGICSGGGGWWLHDCPQWESFEEHDRMMKANQTIFDKIRFWWLRFKIKRGWLSWQKN